MDLEGEFEVLEFDVGRTQDRARRSRSCASSVATATHLEEILRAITASTAPSRWSRRTRGSSRRRGRRLPRRVLLDDEPRDLRPPRRRVGARSRTPRWTAACASIAESGHGRDRADERRDGRRALRRRPQRPARAAARAPAREPAVRVHGLGCLEREAQGADRARGGAPAASGARRRQADDRRGRPGGGAHGGGATLGAPHRGGLRRRPLRRQRRRHARHRVGPVRHVARHLPDARARRHPAATSTTCAPSTPSGAAAASRPPSSRACSRRDSCTRA